MFRYIMLSGLIILVVLGCGDNHPKQPEVHVYGSLKNIMHKGDLSSKFLLNDLSGKEHVYALGAVENLKGEILIWDGKPYVSQVLHDSMVINESLEHNAALLVYAEVNEWQQVKVPDSVTTYEQLEQFIDTQAQISGLDIEQPFPFLLIGNWELIKWHVINWKDGDKIHTHEKHKASGLRGTLKGIDAEVLGFYSRHHHTIFTHHSTNMHLHVMDPVTGIYAHADEVETGKFVTLGLPKVSSK